MFLKTIFIGFIFSTPLSERIKTLSETLIANPTSYDESNVPAGNILTNCKEVYEFLHDRKYGYNDLHLYSDYSEKVDSFYFHLEIYTFARNEFLTEEMKFNLLEKTILLFENDKKSEAKHGKNSLLAKIYELLKVKSAEVFSEEISYPLEPAKYPKEPKMGSSEAEIGSLKEISERLEAMTFYLETLIKIFENSNYLSHKGKTALKNATTALEQEIICEGIERRKEIFKKKWESDRGSSANNVLWIR